jgi:dienelactone hydrolase
MREPVSSHSFTVGSAKYTIDRFAAQTGAAKWPVVVILHGVDGMVGESETEIRKLAKQIAGDGYLVFLPHYLDSTPGVTGMPSLEVMVARVSQVDTYRPRVAAAFDYVLKQPDIDDARLGIVGLSLGGGLGLWYAESAPRAKAKAVVDFFGHISDPTIYSNAGQLPPTLVFHNKDDGVVRPEHSVALVAALAGARVVHDSQIYEEPPYPERYHHTFRPGGKADLDSRARTRKWLDTYVKP